MDSYDRETNGEGGWWERNKDNKWVKLAGGIASAVVVLFFFAIDGCGRK